jgi:uncharacterized membrane protein YfcA
VIEAAGQAFSAALATEGVLLLAGVVFVAGLVRGFTGFGTAMIYMPFAAALLPPVWALTVMLVFDLLGMPPLIPRALKDADRGDLARLSLGVLIAAPIGLLLPSRFDPTVFGWILSAIILVLLAFVAAGWRYRGRLSRRMVVSVGAFGGFLAGMSGLAGPPVIMFYMSRPLPVQVIRANILLFLVLADLLTAIFMGLGGLLDLEPLAIGALMILPYVAGGLAGSALFNPAHERVYRFGGYLVILVAALVNLPVFR